jgi:protein SCO1/2
MRAVERPPQTVAHPTAALREADVKAGKLLVTVIAGALALGAGVWLALRMNPPTATVLQSGVLLAAPRPIAAFQLTDQDGQPFTAERLRGRWSVLFAGFTHCPDVCPTTLAVMKVVAQKIGDAAPAMLFLSVDPERDTPAVLKQYVQAFGPAVTAVTGERASLDALCASLGIAYVKIPGASDRDYTVDHSAALVLIDPQGRVAGYFPPPHKADTLAADLAGLIARS